MCRTAWPPSQDAGRGLESCPCLHGRLRDLAGPGPGHAASKGDFNFKVPTSSDPAAKTGKRAAETVNGRLAMMVIIGMFIQAGLAGSAWGDRALRTASPLRTVESVLGAQAPVCVWEPAGLAASGCTESLSATAGQRPSAATSPCLRP